MTTKPGVKIILADDNAQVAEVLSEILTEYGHTVRTAIDGNAVPSSFSDFVPDVLATDLNMPGMSRFALIPLVRQSFSGVVIIAMSGAYTPYSIPECVVSDEFYPNGSGSITRLLEMVDRVRSRPSPGMAAAHLGNSLEIGMRERCGELQSACVWHNTLLSP